MQGTHRRRRRRSSGPRRGVTIGLPTRRRPIGALLLLLLLVCALLMCRQLSSSSSTAIAFRTVRSSSRLVGGGARRRCYANRIVGSSPPSPMRLEPPPAAPVEAVSASARVSTARRMTQAPREQPQAERQEDTGDPPPPRYDGTALARMVFADPYFYGGNVKEAKRREALRHEKLQDMTVREAFQSAYGRSSELDAIQGLSADMEAYVSCVSDYFNGADVATKQELASKALEVGFSCTFHVAELQTSVIQKSLYPLLRVESNVERQADSDSLDSRTIDMSFLETLRFAEEEKFLVPDKLYVRDSMRRVFGLFHEDAMQIPRREPDKAYSAALIGSPGVGKSILFFLAALDQACTSNVVYYRKSGEERLSVFVMTPPDDGHSVRIWYTRNMPSERLDRGLSTASIALERCRILQRGDFYDFVDGPTYGDKPNTFDGNYDYLCPSGGIPRYKNDEQDKRVWVLDGWTEDEAAAALVALHNQSSAVAQQAYFLCGGIIRDMLQACSSYNDVKHQLDELVEHCDRDSLELVAGGTQERAEDPGNPDRLRTMFELRYVNAGADAASKKSMASCQVVDSPYVIDKLYSVLPAKTWQDSYDHITWWTHLGQDVGPVIERLFSRTPFLD
jgi:hypothetical protein